MVAKEYDDADDDDGENIIRNLCGRPELLKNSIRRTFVASYLLFVVFVVLSRAKIAHSKDNEKQQEKWNEQNREREKVFLYLKINAVLRCAWHGTATNTCSL